MEILKTGLTLSHAITATDSGDPESLTDIDRFGNCFNVSLRAKTGNTGNVYFRVDATNGEYIPLAATETAAVTVRTLSDIDFYSDTGSEVLSFIIDHIAAEYYE